MSLNKFHVAIFASGNGSNAEQIINYFKDHPLVNVEVVLTNNPKAFVIQRAERLGIEVIIFSREDFTDPNFMEALLSERRITHIVLAGFLWLVPNHLIQRFPNRIINIHPALLPKFGGRGMYGNKVHEAVKLAGEAETGITIHLVNERYDEGQILFQGKCEVQRHYSPTDISECVQKLEFEHYPRVIEKWILGPDSLSAEG
jgi:phosphoribosylglycinamide formyltransferase 1